MKKHRLVILLVLAALIIIVIVILATRGGSRGDLATQIADAQTEGTPGAQVTPRSTATPGIDGLAYLLTHEDYDLRLATAKTLVKRDDLSVEDRVTLLVGALSAESSSPSPDDPPVPESYLTPGEGLRLAMARSLTALGPDALPAVQAALAGADGLAREHILVALAYLGDADVLPEVRDLVISSGDVAVRMDAARALGLAGDSGAIPALKQALADPALAEGTDSLGEFTIYPVREQAASALVALGVRVTRGENETFTVEGN
jgi:hypothetical protein